MILNCNDINTLSDMYYNKKDGSKQNQDSLINLVQAGFVVVRTINQQTVFVITERGKQFCENIKL